MSAQELVVAGLIVLAVLYLLRHFFGRKKPKKRKPGGKPDVPLDRLRRKK